MKEQVRQRIESLERELQGLKDELQPEVKVGSWWLGNVSEHKAKVTKVDSRRVHYTYEDRSFGALQFHNFTNRFTPCEAPAKETWYLCTEDLGPDDFTRGKEYKMSSKNPLSLIDEEGFPHKLIGWAKYFVNPQER
jgi:hypothetical protein